MLPVEYIKNNLNHIATSFPNTCFKYGFDKTIKTHVIEITPEDDFYNSELLSEAWVNMSVDFMTKYPTEDIVFISSDSSLALENYNFSCNNQKESKLLHSFFEEFLTTELNLWFDDSPIIEKSLLLLNLTDKPFQQMGKSDFDSNELLMAA